ncbi:acyl-CoA dehydrogenase family protein [Janibacter cremeus]|uniref:acyl-CoA dehydrogenase family protein n=1 Tax=Janibacter cremeus TaxID=1285192 RepID=UPI0023F75867|nr:acyl-CoA dehydrogenase family protein [Janibacter cremeus]WEV79001.1 acyl-CoA dehydrogenase family protein [Janibacter cremeus]
MPTHEVTNQPPPLGGQDVFSTDPALVEGVARWVPAAQHETSVDELTALGLLAGSEEAAGWADRAHRNTPRLVTHDRFGHRVDEVEFDPGWHELMRTAAGAGLTGEAWTQREGSGAHVRRAAGLITWSQVEPGHICPITMTNAAVPALRHSPELAARWEEKLASRDYHFGLREAGTKSGVIAGMGMTEKQGGSDVRANTTHAVAAPGGPMTGQTYRLSGHKWFCSAPMSDVFLVLAKTTPDAAPSCFLVPRVLEDGTRNPFALQRLKDKLGDRSNASSEVELDGTWGALVGEEGRGVRAIIDMVATTRLDCILGSAATMRASLTRAVHHTQHRVAFGRALVDQPLMRNVLTDLALESEAATLLGLRLAHALDEGDTELTRLGVAVGKYWVCKRASTFTAEAMECLGGNGYVEEHGMARLYRQAPLNSIWEGSGNVNALDVLRAIAKEPASLMALLKEASVARGQLPVLDAALDDLERDCSELGGQDAERVAMGSRQLVERLALALQASLMVAHSPGDMAEAFVASRLGGAKTINFGTLDPDLVTLAGATAIHRASASV